MDFVLFVCTLVTLFVGVLFLSKGSLGSSLFFICLRSGVGVSFAPPPVGGCSFCVFKFAKPLFNIAGMLEHLGDIL